MGWTYRFVVPLPPHFRGLIPSVGVLLLGACATTGGTTERVQGDEAGVGTTTGGATDGRKEMPPGPWNVDTLTVTNTCGTGGGLLATQLLNQRGYRVVSTGSSTRAEIECAWTEEEVHVWTIDTERGQGECVAEGVRRLDLHLKVIGRPHPQLEEALLAEATFQARARLEHEPPHRGCVVRKEEDVSILARGLRSVVARIPVGGDQPPPLVAPLPASADVVTGQAGPGAPEAAGPKSIYPVDFGNLPAPREAVSSGRVAGATESEVISNAKVPARRDGEAPGPSGLVVQPLKIHPFWRRFEVGVEVVTAGCTDFCGQLYSGGVGPGIRLLFRAHDLVALEGGWRRVGLEARDRDRVPDDVETVLTDLDLGGRLYVGSPGSIRAYGGLGVAFVDLGDEWQGAGQTEGTRFRAFSTRLLAGGEAPLTDWLRVGAHLRYDRPEWEEVCERGASCEEVDSYHPIVGSDIWSMGAEVTLALP